jgi:hypothetical protein
MDFFSVPRGDCRFLEQNDTRLKGYVEIGVDAEACVFLPDPGDGGYAGSYSPTSMKQGENKGTVPRFTFR